MYAVAATNLVTASQTQDLFEFQKRLKQANSAEMLPKLNSRQRCLIACNTAILELLMNKPKQCIETVSEIIERYPADDLPYVVLAAAQMASSQSPLAIATLKDRLSRKADSPRVVLALAELLLLPNPAFPLDANAISSLLKEYLASEKSIDVWFFKGAFSICQRLDKAASNNHRLYANELVDLVMKKDSSAPVLRAIGEVRFADGHFEDAARLYERLYRMNPEDREVLARLILSLSSFDVEQARRYEGLLRSDADSEGAIDVDALENTQIHRLRKLFVGYRGLVYWY